MLAVPTLAYLYALWSLRRAAAGVARGGGFGATLAAALRRVGAGLIVGAVTALAGAALIGRLSVAPPTRSIDLDVASLVVAGLGVGLFLIARLLAIAERQASELAEFF